MSSGDIDALTESLKSTSLEEKTTDDFKVIDAAKAIKRLGARLRAGMFKKVCMLSGAGISVSAGIPDFRTPGSGLYDNLQKYNLPSPTAVFELDFFRNNPKPFCTLAKELEPTGFHPTPMHFFIRLMEQKGVLLHVITQNIDGLEFKAGVPEDKVTQAHGGFGTAHCISCKESCNIDDWRSTIMKDEIPRCNKNGCTGLIKPDIIFFGEPLNRSTFTNAERYFPSADLLLVAGTSLAVYPVAAFPDDVDRGCTRVLMNCEKVGNFQFSDPKSRDYFLQGPCDASAMHLAMAAGWGKDLLELMETYGHEKGCATLKKVMEQYKDEYSDETMANAIEEEKKEDERRIKEGDTGRRSNSNAFSSNDGDGDNDMTAEEMAAELGAAMGTFPSHMQSFLAALMAQLAQDGAPITGDVKNVGTGVTIEQVDSPSSPSDNNDAQDKDQGSGSSNANKSS